MKTKDISDSNYEAKDKTECQPKDGVIIDFVGRFAMDRGDEDGPIFHEATDCLIVIGDKYVNPALEMGVRFMHEGQKAIIWSTSKFAYGLSTRKNGDYELPPNSNVRYEIFVKSVISPDKESSDPDGFQLQLAMSKKIIANDMFKNELYAASNHGSQQRALRLYSKAADEMVHLIQTHQTQKQENSETYDKVEGKKKTNQAMEIMLDCLNNVVAVHMKAKKYHEAKEAAVKVLTHDPDNLKALLRAARAAMMDPSGTYEESDVAIAAAEKVVQEKGLDDKGDVRKLRQELKQKKQEYKKRRKEMMARMTKELKPKEQQPIQKATGSDSKIDPPKHEQDTAVDDEVAASPEVPLWRSMLPYILQIVFPFVLYYTVVYTSRSRTEVESMQSQPEVEQMDTEF